MATKIEFNVTNEEHEKFLRKYQESLQSREPEEGGKKITLSDTALHVFGQGVSRVKATTKYAKAHPTEKKPRAPKAPKAAKPPKAKAKGPLARKQASSKAKAPKVRKAPTVKDLAAHDAATTGAPPAPGTVLD